MGVCLLSASAQAQIDSGPSGRGATAGESPASAASAASGPAASAPSLASPVASRRWATVLKVNGHLQSKDLGVVINMDDPYSVKVGEYYVKARGIARDRVLKLSLPTKAALTRDEFESLAKQVNDYFGQRVQGLALAWRQPYAVDCNSITGALTMGYDAQLCKQTCAPSRPSPYFGSYSTQPFKDHGMRLSMLLAARDVDQAIALIDRGVKSDHTLGLRGAPAVNVHFVTTSDRLRSQRQLLFPPEGRVPALGIDVHLDQTDALRDADRVLMYLTGRQRVEGLDTVEFVPGALADHLTSFGGMLDHANGQMSVLSWIEAGATATYGTTSEPCAHLQKFPHPQALLLFYAGGATALEAYWKSVQWPQQGLFVGEPLATPFSR
ncbi:MAG: TIGR03790 family protein [Acidobacteriota bacterium]